MSLFAQTPKPPYYAVIFSSQRTEGDRGYGEMAGRMVELAAGQPGFLGVESVRDESGFGITVSYWSSLDAIRDWKRHEEHRVAQEKGRQMWYGHYITRICKVERDYTL
ncbi:antibiotic biosynthesis monooxygenase family protein [Brevibacillus agri]|uniref:antibiotic biosynthesis monooxygenase family protein n=1 Tax=Brevibacillus agri TaxID=51101 RepID=UPI00047259E8|nr:antibiotic biosynthesis monooxygenase [Brevibacillus agri]MCG5252402.1 antibiotic biosynthesis monooxygenase [Brevibacillus agri]MED4572957.1 antibiotic biosynthesis monooxygenase [Brevibacillus agri]WHX29530.1 antibiotic biosynthesis monooxygenase [Brevibacillus agri]